MSRTLSVEQLVDRIMEELEKKWLGPVPSDPSAAASSDWQAADVLKAASAMSARSASNAASTSNAMSAGYAASASNAMSESNATSVSYATNASNASYALGAQDNDRDKAAAGEAVGESSGSRPDSVPREGQVPEPKWKEGLQELLLSTPARIGVWRAGTRPLTKEVLQFRCDHAAAVDAIYGTVHPSVLEPFGMLQVESLFENTDTYLRRPDLGRLLTEPSMELIRTRCKVRPQIQIVVSDGLSANAIEANLKDIYPSLLDSLRLQGLAPGTPIFVRGGRVAVMDLIGELLQPEALVLLIGERPGLVSSQSMSAYMCYRPRRGTVESDRTVISNIHHSGTPPVEAGAHIGTVLRSMLEQKASGIHMEL